MHQPETGEALLSQNIRIVGFSESPEGYVARIQIPDTNELLSKTVKSISLDDELISRLLPQDALQIGFWLGIESAS